MPQLAFYVTGHLPSLLRRYQIKKRGVMIYAYANNHFGGHAPATIEQFRNLWHAKGLPELNKPLRRRPKESLLFE
jgi:hypothetical protein